MDRQVDTMERLFHQKILLYRDLLENLKEERGYLIETNVDALWDVSARKQQLVEAIEGIREEILHTLSDMSIPHGMTVATFSLSQVVSLVSHLGRNGLTTANLTLIGLKTEVRQLSRENKQFIEQSLDFLDELIGVIAESGDRRNLYDDGGALTGNRRSNMLLVKEA